MTAASDTAPGDGKKAVVVGAGPGGCLTACLLAQAGWSVDLFERRAADAAVGTAKQPAGPGWLVSLYPSGQELVARAAPSSVPFLEGHTYLGFVLHREGEAPEVSERSGVLLRKGALNSLLLKEIATKHADRIRIHYEHTFQGADFDMRFATFKAAPGASPKKRSPKKGSSVAPDKVVVHYDLLVGADGADSSVRAALMASFPKEFKLQVLSGPSDRTFKCFTGLPAGPETKALTQPVPPPPPPPAPAAAANSNGNGNGASPKKKGKEPEPQGPKGTYFNVLTTKAPTVSCAASLDPDTNTFGGMFGMPREELAAMDGKPQAWEAYLKASAPLLPASWIKPLSSQLAAAPIYSMPAVQRTSRLALPGAGAVLIGDAGHTVTPLLGHGLNSALEDAGVLVKLLGEVEAAGTPAPVHVALKRFGPARMPEVRAMQELELMKRLSNDSLLAKWNQDPAWITWLKARGQLYSTLKSGLSGVVERCVGPANAQRLPAALRGGPFMEVEAQDGAVSYSAMLRLVDCYCLTAAAAAGTVLLGTLRVLAWAASARARAAPAAAP